MILLDPSPDEVIAANAQLREAARTPPTEATRATLIAQLGAHCRAWARAEVERADSVRSPLDGLLGSSHSSDAMVRWALQTTFADVTARRLLECILQARNQGERGQPIGLLGVILSANVLTAPARALLLPLLFGVPVCARVSQRESAFACALRELLVATCTAPDAGRTSCVESCAESGCTEACLVQVGVPGSLSAAQVGVPSTISQDSAICWHC